MNATQLATVICLAGMTPHEEPEEPVFEAEHGQKIVINYRNAERGAHFLRVEKDKVIVLHQGTERRIRPDLVRLPREDEFPDVADNINEPAPV